MTKKSRARSGVKQSPLQVAYTKLFRSDIEVLKQQAEEGVPWQTQLRTLVHRVLTGPKLRAFKFMIKAGSPRSIAENVAAEGCMAVAIAHSREEAEALLSRIATEEGQDYRWLKVADVVELPLDSAIRICWYA
jgi:hypothetical protein